MTDAAHIKYLRIALVIVGLIFIFGIWPLTILWPSGWSWHSGGRSDYLEMILGIYATLGVFLIIASRDPMAHKSLISFTVWSSIVHGVVMAVQSVENPQHIGHLWGDVLALTVVGIVLAVLRPRQTTETLSQWRHTPTAGQIAANTFVVSSTQRTSAPANSD